VSNEKSCIYRIRTATKFKKKHFKKEKNLCSFKVNPRVSQKVVRMSTGVKVLKPGDLKNAINSLERNIRNISISLAKDEMELLKQGDVDMCLKLLRVMLFEVSHDMV